MRLSESIIVAMIGLVMAGLLLAAPSVSTAADPVREVKIADMAGRTVTVTGEPRRIICLGPGALRLICYLGRHDLVVGIEAFEKSQPLGRSYRYAMPSLLTLPVIGPGGPASTNKEPDLEAVLKVKPHLIFVTYMDAARADGLQKKLGIPVVVLSYGRFGAFTEELFESLRVAGRILNKEKRADELKAFVARAQAELARRAEGAGAGAGPVVYVGGVGYRGVQGIESTETDYLPLDWVRGRNVAKEAGKSGHLFVDKEQILAWNPDVILLDGFGLTAVAPDIRKKPDFYRALKAVRNQKVYVIWPFNAYVTNVDTVIVAAFTCGKLLFPDRFRDVDIDRKADEVYSFFVGSSVTAAMKRDFGESGAPWKSQP